jgi:hypothetical protein
MSIRSITTSSVGLSCAPVSVFPIVSTSAYRALVLELVPGPARPGAGGVAALDHEAVDHAMEGRARLERLALRLAVAWVGPLPAAGGEIREVLHRLGRCSGISCTVNDPRFVTNVGAAKPHLAPRVVVQDGVVRSVLAGDVALTGEDAGIKLGSTPHRSPRATLTSRTLPTGGVAHDRTDPSGATSPMEAPVVVVPSVSEVNWPPTARLPSRSTSMSFTPPSAEASTT